MSDIFQTEELRGWKGYTLEELSQRLLLDRQFIVECVEYGIAKVPGGEPAQWTFPATAILRIQKAWRLHRDLEIHLNNLALVLDLLDEREALRQEVEALRQRLAHWESG